MLKTSKFYLKHMNAQTAYRATWDPGRKLTIGQVGKLDDAGVFNVFTSLEAVGIPMQVDIDTTSGEVDYTSSNSVTISTKLAGKAPVAGSVLTDTEVGFSFDFKSDKAVVFKASGLKTNHITNLADIQTAILAKYADGTWPKDYLIITELVSADAATIIISNSANSKLDLKASAAVGAGSVKLTDASLGLTVAHEQGSIYKYITQGGLTPLYRLMGVRKPLFSDPIIDTRGEETEGKLELKEMPFEEEEIKENV
jgi:hypothetical protein